jgi:hypothetical protein
MEPQKLKKRFIIASIGYTLFMMWLSPNGSFNPLNVGFYSSILGGIIWYLLTYNGFKLIMRKHQK